jgi:hypothetical protein
VFETIALAIHHGSSAGGAPSVSKKVSTNLLTQIGRDIKAVNLLASSGFPYQAVAVSVSAFEHGMMVASIGNDDARAQEWLDHSDPGHNLERVAELVRLALERLYPEASEIPARRAAYPTKQRRPLDS